MQRIACLCTGCMLLSGIAAPFSAEALTVCAAPVSGEAGESLTWELDTETGTLTISGTGDMYGWYDRSYTSYGGDLLPVEERPWNAYLEQIRSIVIEKGVTSVGAMAFHSCIACTDVTVAESVESIGFMSFADCFELERITILNPGCLIYQDSATICNMEFKALSMPYDDEYAGVILGYGYSTAQNYAERYGYAFEAVHKPALETGDIDGDGAVTVLDAQTALLACLESLTGGANKLSDAQLAAADVDGSGKVTVSDAQCILIYYVHNTVAETPITWEETFAVNNIPIQSM